MYGTTFPSPRGSCDDGGDEDDDVDGDGADFDVLALAHIPEDLFTPGNTNG